MMRILLISLLSFSSVALAVEPVIAPGLLPTETARALLEQDPSVAAAHAGLEVARQEAGILDKSPYEWITRVTGQQRRIESGPEYNEWSVGVERAIRLPGKAAADRNIGKVTIEQSEAQYGEAIQEAARDLLSLWVDWLAAERVRELAQISLQSVQASLMAVELRLRAGDASKLDMNIARAELAEQKRINNDASTQAIVAWSRLSARFPSLNRQIIPLPIPSLIKEDVTFWRDRILAESDELKIVQAQMRKAEAYANRAREDKLPDPTFGVHTASESGGRERIAGVTISIPIPGGVRDLRSAKATAVVEVSRQEIEQKKRQLEAAIVSAVATAQGNYDSLQIAKEGAAEMQDNANLMQRAYALGEAELQTLLLARRQATAAMNNALQAQAMALKAYYGLLVDAHLIWDLSHD